MQLIRTVLLALLVGAGVLAGAGGARAQGCGPQNPNCVVPTAPTADSSNRAASTAFVHAVAGGVLPLASGQIYIGQTNGFAAGETPSGDCTISLLGAITCTKTNGVNFGVFSTGTNAANLTGTMGAAQLPAFGSGDVSCASGGGACTIAANAVTNAKLAQAAANSMKCNNTGSFADAIDCTVAQVQQLLNGWFNVLNSQTGAYAIVSSDAGKTIQAGTGSSGLFAVTLPSVSGFVSNAIVAVTNGDTGRGKQLIGFPADVYCQLYPGQTVQVSIVNGAWVTTQNPGRWRPTGTAAFNTDSSNGHDTCASDGLGTGAGAFATPQYAYAVWSQHLDGGQSSTNLVTATIQDASVNVAGGWLFVGARAPGYYATATTKPFRVLGKGPSNTTVTSSTTGATNFNLQGGAELQIDQMTISSTGPGASCVTVVNDGEAFVSAPSTGSVNFGQCTNVAMDAAGGRAAFRMDGPFGQVNINNVGIFLVESGATGFVSDQMSGTGTNSISSGVFIGDYTSRIDLTGFSLTGAGYTGPKGSITGNAILFTNGLGCTTGLPGTTAISTATGGECI